MVPPLLSDGADRGNRTRATGGRGTRGDAAWVIGRGVSFVGRSGRAFPEAAFEGFVALVAGRAIARCEAGDEDWIQRVKMRNMPIGSPTCGARRLPGVVAGPNAGSDGGMAEQRRLEIDFRDILAGLRPGERVRGAEAMGARDEIFRAKDHSYRRVDDYTLLHVLNFEAGLPYSLRMARPDLVCIQAIVSGTYSRWIGQRLDLVGPHRLEISNTPCSVVDVTAGSRLRGLLIICDRRHLVEHYRLNPDRLPAVYRPIFLSPTGTPEVLHLPLSALGLHLVDQILTCKYQEPLRGIFVGAKTIEIICDVVAQLGTLPAHAAPRPTGARHKARAVEAAAEIYRREFGNPPTIEQLALRIGLNRNELTSGFRETFGVTPHAYALIQRMERARAMLREGRLSISEVARRIGYEGYSSFSRAYQAHYGCTPSLDVPATDPATLDLAASAGPDAVGPAAPDLPAGADTGAAGAGSSRAAAGPSPA